MLTHLTIRNYALIRHLELNPSGHLNVITGETGAGKSIMLGAIGLLMGNRADTKVLWDEQEKCVTEGTFTIGAYKLQKFFQEEDLDYADTTIIRREISPGGKSRAFINDTPVTLDVMKKLAARLLDIHSQHETLQLGQQTFQLSLIDAYAENQLLMQAYSDAWEHFVAKRRELNTLTQEADTLRQEADYINFQLDELVKAGLEAGEQEKLEQEVKIIEHAEDIKARFNTVLDMLMRSDVAATTLLAEARNHLQTVAAITDRYELLFKRLDSTVIELKDMLHDLEAEEERIEFDPERATFIKERINTLYRLQKKHRVTSVSELLAIQEELQRKASITNNLDEALKQARLAFEQAEKNLLDKGKKLSASRKKIIPALTHAIKQLLLELGIPDATLTVHHDQKEPDATGMDAVEIMFSANKGIAPRPLASVASGGEFSRLMFCVKYVMAEKTAMPTLILDEIDSGVSGEIAIKLGMLMKRMATRHQLLCISHLPQIAAKAHTQYYVYKDNTSAKTVSNIRLLNDDERVEAIAKMIGGEKPSRVAFENARELLVS